MAQSLEFLTRQNSTLKSIRSIVHTMKTLAAINSAPYERAASSIEAYQHSIENGLKAYAHKARPEYRSPKIEQELLVAFGSDHGLCGSYNLHLAAQVQRYLQQWPARRQRLICVGDKMHQALEEQGLNVLAVLQPPASVEGVTRTANQVVAAIQAHSELGLNDSAISLAFTQRAEHNTRHPVIEPLLPLPQALLKPQAIWPSRSLPTFSMNEEALLQALIRNYIFAKIYRAQAEAMATENAARLALMQQAEQAVDDRLVALKQEITQVRQDEITNELMDIIVGHLEENA